MSHVERHATVHGVTRLTKPEPTDIPASVRARLMNRSRETREDFQLLLTRYGIERFLYRVAKSKYADRFVLKGAVLFQIWTGAPHRPTRDLDLLGRGDQGVDVYEQMFHDICRTQVDDDGLRFDPSSVQVDQIKEEDEYQGLRIKLESRLQNARIRLQVDIGFGDAIHPAPEVITYPGLLDFPTATLPAYPKETVIAEKFQAMVALGIANSRMKDFFDVWTLINGFEFNGSRLTTAIRETFRRRKTNVPSSPPLALTEEFATESSKSKQWLAFQKRISLDATGPSLSEINADLRRFFSPMLASLANDDAAPGEWPPGGPWSG